MLSNIKTSWISKDEIKDKYPTVFATDHICSDRYKLINSEQIIDYFDQNNWGISRISAPKSKINKDHCKHLVAFRSRDVSNIMVDPRNLNKPMFPEILMLNSSDGRSSLEFMAGIFALVCSNGMIIQKQNFDFMRHRHINISQNDVTVLINKFINSMQSINADVNRFSRIILNDVDLKEYTEKAMSLRFKVEDNIPKQNLVTQARRADDVNIDLWTKFNVIQENLIKGGLHTEKRKTRELKEINRVLDINKELWNLTDSYAKKYELVGVN